MRTIFIVAPMANLKKYLSIFVLISLIASGLIESSHHHGDIDPHNDCAICLLNSTAAAGDFTGNDPAFLPFEQEIKFFLGHFPLPGKIIKSFDSLPNAPPRA